MNPNFEPQDSPSEARGQRSHAADPSTAPGINAPHSARKCPNRQPPMKTQAFYHIAAAFGAEFAVVFALLYDIPVPLSYAKVWFSRSRLFARCTEGQVELVTISGRKFIRPSELKRFIESECSSGTPKPKAAVISFPVAQVEPKAEA